MADDPTRIGLDATSSTVATGYPAHILTGIILRLIREHFASLPDLEYNGKTVTGWDLSKYLWSADTTKTGIQIQPAWAWNAQDVQRRPGIYVFRNAMKVIRIALDHGMTTGPERFPDGRIIEVKGEYHSCLLEGSHDVAVVSKTADEVEILGQEVFNHLLEFGPLIRREFRLNFWDVSEFGEINKLEESQEHFVTRIVVSWRASKSWRIRGIAPWLKTLEIKATPT